MTYQEAVIKGAESRVLRSELTGKEYLISVALPYGYDDDPDKKWPVVFLLDALLLFGMVTDIVRAMNLCGSVQGAIVVGIGYATDAPLDVALQDMVVGRFHDLTPVRYRKREKSATESVKQKIKTGGGAKFLEFINTELISLVESNYRVDMNERTLAGQSLGGLFTLFAMFQNAAQFRNYIAVSPALYWKEQIMLEYEAAFASKNRALPASLFLSMGELENDDDDDSFDGMLRLFDQLESRGYAQLEMEKKIFPDEDHCSAAAPGLQAGLKIALRN